MNKVLRVLAVMQVVVMLLSCNGMEHKAKKLLRDTMEELAKNPDTYKISYEKIVFSNDSMCVISFIGRGENGFGGVASSKYEYSLIKLADKDKTDYIEVLLDMDEDNERNKSIKRLIKKIDSGNLYGSDLEIWNLAIKEEKMTKEQAKAHLLYLNVLFNSISHGRKIESNE